MVRVNTLRWFSSFLLSVRLQSSMKLSHTRYALSYVGRQDLTLKSSVGSLWQVVVLPVVALHV